MNTVIIYNHPYDGSFCHAILESVIRGDKKAGHNIDVIDLDKDKFNPVMTSADLLAFKNQEMIDTKSLDYVNRLKKADNLMFIFPIWWELMPAMTKGFIDKVLFPRSTYEYSKSGNSMLTLLPNLKNTFVISTMNTPKLMYKFIYGNAIKRSLINGSLKKTGIKNVKWISFNMVKFSKLEKRKSWLENLEEKISNIAK